MTHYCTQFIKSQMFHCRIFIILPPAYVFDIRCSMGSHPTNCHRIWEACWCTWTLKADWISDLYQSWLCVCAQYKFCIINCALLYGSRRTQMWHILQKTSCKFYKTGHCCTSSVYKAAPCFVQQPSNTVVGQESALYFNHALPIPSVLYSIHLLHIIVLCTS